MSEDPFDDLAPVPAPEPAPASGPGPEAEGAPGFDPAALAEGAQLALNDLGNGRRFVLHHGRDAIWVPRVGWHVWDGRLWERDQDKVLIRRRVQQLSDIVAAELPFLPMDAATAQAAAERDDVRASLDAIEAVPVAQRSDGQKAELGRLRARARDIEAILERHHKRLGRHRAFAITTGNSARMDNALVEAGVDLATPFDDLDADPLAVNVRNGTLRFRVSGPGEGASRVADMVLAPADRADRITKSCAVAYDPHAPAPEFDAFMARIQPDGEMRAFLQRWLGLSLTARPVQRIVFFHGGGANGKSVLIDTVAQIAGTYAATARIESLTGQNRRGGGDATPDLIPLMGARLVRSAEPDEGQRLQEGLLKELTGGEPLLVRALHSDFVEVRPVFKLTISGNHKPEIRGTDDGIWRRLWLVPFEVQIPEDERDEEFGARLVAREAPGILNWLIEGLLDALEGGLRPPPRVVDATREYREEQDPIGVFLASCCVVTGDPADAIAAKELGDAFAYHLLERGMTAWKPSTFARRIAPMAGQWRHPETGRQFAKGKSSISQYTGLRLTDAFRRRFRDAPKDHTGRPLGVAEALRAEGGAGADEDGWA